MPLSLLSNCLLQWVLIEIVTAQMPAAKYIQMGNMAPVRPNVPNRPSVPMHYPSNPTISSLLNNYLPNYNLPLPFTNLPNTPMTPMSQHMNVPLPFTNVPPIMPNPPLNPLALPLPAQNMKLPTPSNFLDPSVMNNLAIALHLLILNNLLHPEDAKPNLAETPPQPTPPTYPQTPPVPNPQYQQPNYFPEPQESSQPFPPPNSKFLGSSGFAEPSLPSLMGAPLPYNNAKPPRNNHSLMSPYEALGPQPGKDAFAQYGPQNLKADFQSPYNSIMASDNANKDLFSMF